MTSGEEDVGKGSPFGLAGGNVISSVIVESRLFKTLKLELPELPSGDTSEDK